MKTEIKSLTGLRGIAAFLVMTMHYFTPYLSHYNDVENTFISKILYRTISKSYIAVDLFFILSAYVLTLSYLSKFQVSFTTNDYFQYFKKRIIRIFPLYFFCLLINIPLQNFNFIDFLINLSLSQVVFKTPITSAIGPTWSLSTEFLMYIIFPFLLLYINKVKHVLILIIFSLMVVFSNQYIPTYYFDVNELIVKKIPVKGSFDLFFGTSAMIRTLTSYVLGILFFKNFNRLPNFNFLLTLLIFIVCLYFKANDFIIYLFCFLFLKLAIAKNFFSKILSHNFFYFLGEISFSIYLIHIIIKGYLIKFSPLEWPIDGLKFNLLCLIATIILATFTFYFIEKKSKNYFSNNFLN